MFRKFVSRAVIVILLSSVFLGPGDAVGQLIPEGEFPFGPYSGAHHANDTVFYSDEVLEFMHDSLGYNQFTTGGIDENTAARLVSHDIYSYPWGTFAGNPWTIEPQTKYAGVQYFICQAESTTGYFNVRFKDRGGWVYQDSLWACRNIDTMLGGLTMLQTNKYDWLDPFNNLEYHPYLKVGVDSTTKADSLVTDTMLVGVFKVWQHWPTPDTLKFIDSIYVRDLPYGHDTLLALVDDRSGYSPNPYYTLSEGTDNGQRFMLFEFVKPNSNCTLYVDYFKVHSQFGLELMEEDQFANIIKQYTGREGYRGKILGWFLKDIQYPGNMRPFAYIDSLIRDTTRVWGADSVRAAGHVVPVSGSGTWTSNDGYRDFMRYTHPRLMWSFLYPIWLNTAYAGYSDNPNETLQKDFEFYLTVPCDSIRKALNVVPSSSWMYVPQYWYCDPDDPDYPCSNNSETRRKPTESEMRCMTYLGLCYHPKGIMFYKYDSSPGATGLVNPDGEPTPGMYDVVKDEINPYLKAIDDIYLELLWRDAYPYKLGNFSPPQTAYVSSIWAASIVGGLITEEDPNFNPDRGWFHIGEYTKSGVSDKYVMLVNRACSRGLFDSTEAPPVVATTKFSATNLALGDYVYVVDLADSIRHAGVDTGWVAYAETTYTAKMPDGKIPFTTTFRAGEGRLFKIVAAR